MPVPTLAVTLGLLLAGETAAVKPPAAVPVQLSPLGFAKDCIWGLAFSPDGKTVAGGTFEGYTLLWERASGKELCRVRLRPEEDEDPRLINFLAFSPDGKKLATVHDTLRADRERGQIGLWEVTPDRHLRTLRSFRANSAGSWKHVCQVAFSRDGKTLAIGEPEGTVHLWDVDTGRERLCFQGGVAVSFAPDGRTMTSVGHDGMIYRWAAGTNRLIDQPAKRTDFLHVDHVAFGPAGRLVAIGDRYTTLLKDAATGQTVRRLDFAPWSLPLAFSADDRLLAVAGENGTSLVETATGKAKALVHGYGPCAFSPDGRFFAWSDGDATTVEAMPVTGTRWARKRATAPAEPDMPLRAELIVNRRTNVLDLGGLTAEEFSREACFGYVPTPTVDLTLTVRNTGTKPLAIRPNLSGMSFFLVGPGALNLWDEIRQTGVGGGDRPDPLTLPPRGAHSWRITSLADEGRAYWLLPGEYTLHVGVHVEIVEPAKGKRDAEGGSRYESLECAPVKLTVVPAGEPSADLLEKTANVPPLAAVVVPQSREMLDFRSKLTRGVRIEFEDTTTLQEALTYIGERYDFDIRIDQAAFKKAGRSQIGDARVKLRPPEGVSLNAVLALVLQDLDAGYEIRKEILWVVPQARPQSLAERLQPTDDVFLGHFYRHVTLKPVIKAGTPLAEALRDLGERLDLPILLDRKAFERAGIKDIDKRPVELGEQVDVRRSTVLRKLVQQAGAAVVTRERVVLVVPGREANR